MRDYNGVTLPELPDVDSSVYPYCFIRDTSYHSRYDLFYCTTNDLSCNGLGTSIQPVTGPYYRVTYSNLATATSWTFYKNNNSAYVGVDPDALVIWSNFDIYNTHTGELFFAGEYEKSDVDAALTLSAGGEAEGTAVTVNFSCTGLSSTEAVYQVCLYAYKQGGTYADAEVICQTGLFAGPSFSGSHTFTELTPETAYEVYAVICRDGTELAATALAAFTTPEEAASAPAYIGDTGGVARHVEGIYIGDADGIAHKVLRAYVGSESSLASLCWDDSAENA